MSALKAPEMNSIQEFIEESELVKSKERKRHFEYNLNDKAAKAKLIKGGKRIPIMRVDNKGSSNLVFSIGAWDTVVNPAIRYWNSIKSDKTCNVGAMTVKIASVSAGMEAGRKHIDTLVVFYANRDKVVCHFYNTTQLVLVNGHGYENFIEHFLKPFFESKIALNLEEITQYNSMALETLGAKRVKRSSVKYKGGSTFPCNACDFATNTLMTLKKHMRIDHNAISMNSSKSSSSIMLTPFKHSTRNNSISDLMQDNMTITDLTNQDSSVTVEEHALKFTCLECKFTTTEKNTMDVHVQTLHGKSNFICGTCSHEFIEEDDYNTHVRIHDRTKKVFETPSVPCAFGDTGVCLSPNEIFYVQYDRAF